MGYTSWEKLKDVLFTSCFGDFIDLLLFFTVWEGARNYHIGEDAFDRLSGFGLPCSQDDFGQKTTKDLKGGYTTKMKKVQNKVQTQYKKLKGGVHTQTYKQIQTNTKNIKSTKQIKENKDKPCFKLGSKLMFSRTQRQIILAKTLLSTDFRDLVYLALRTLVDKFDVRCFNFGMYHLPFGEDPEALDVQRYVIARVVDRGSPTNPSNDWAGAEMFAGAVIISSDPMSVASALQKAVEDFQQGGPQTRKNKKSKNKS